MPERVLHLVPSDLVGGTELLVQHQAVEMARRGIEVEVATWAPPGPIAAGLATEGIPCWSLGHRSPDAPVSPDQALAAIRTARRIQRGRYGVVNAYGFKASLVGRIVGRLARPRPAFVCGVMGLHITEVLDPKGAKGRVALGLERAATSLVDRYEINSRAAIDRLAACGIERSRMEYLPNAIPSWMLERAPARGSGERATFRVLCAARFVERKRQEDLLSAMAELVKQGLPIEAVFAGDGPTRRRCEALAGSLGLRYFVRFEGAVEQQRLLQLMEESDALVLCSLWEGMPAVVLEAMASALPVIGTHVNGIADLVADGRTGLLVAPRSPRALADALRYLLTDRSRREALGRAAREQVTREHTIERFVDRKLEIYARAIAHARGQQQRSPELDGSA